MQNKLQLAIKQHQQTTRLTPKKDIKSNINKLKKVFEKGGAEFKKREKNLQQKPELTIREIKKDHFER